MGRNTLLEHATYCLIRAHGLEIPSMHHPRRNRQHRAWRSDKPFIRRTGL